MEERYSAHNGEPALPDGLRVSPPSALNREHCLALLEAAGVPERVKAHCLAVAAEALRIAEALPVALDRQLIEYAALLHDIARAYPKHPQTGAAWLRALGYGQVADIVQLHHDHDGERLDEAAILFIADKRVKEAELVPLETRFAASAQRCRNDAAKAAFERRYAAAMAIKEKINGLCHKQVVL